MENKKKEVIVVLLISILAFSTIASIFFYQYFRKSYEAITNGDFESGELTYWVVGNTYKEANISSNTYVAHSGNFGCKILSYYNSSYYPGSIEQDLRYAEITSKDIDSFSFWSCTFHVPIRVTINYCDNTFSFQDFYGSSSWEQHFVTEIERKKQLKSVKFETIGGSYNIGGIDDISLKIFKAQKRHLPPFLSEIVPFPSPTGNITIFWSDVPFSDNYSIYRHTSYIEEITKEVTFLATTNFTNYTESDLINDTYYYVVTATNETGSSKPSNCRLVRILGPNDELVEGIQNGDFELGELTYWEIGDAYRPARIDPKVNNVHNGTYGCQLMIWGEGYYHPSSINQNLSNNTIYTDDVVSLSFWMHTSNSIRITITYWDETATNQVFAGPYTWQCHLFINFTLGKRLKGIKIETLENGVNYGGVDDISLIYIADLSII